ncbi:MAG: ABC transporter substrate-binding protein [Clostridia bacterium]|nr:ABC transporter substrate-binding protein [Clostridia bacterium]
MKQHIDTAPIWDSYRQDCECPLCLLYAKVESGNVDYFLGESVMEPSQRVEVNQKGFCARHFKLMYDAGNRLGLALMTHTYMKETIKSLRENAQRARDAAAAEAVKPIFKRLGSQKGAGMSEIVGELRKVEDTCLLCDRIRDNMERYMYTILYMYKHEAEFPKLFEQSKGMCLHHYAQALEMAPKHLSGDALKRFVDTLTDIEIKNFDRLEGEIEWFTNKFDYRNQDKPWGNSRDAVKRSVNKLSHQVVDED